MWQDLGFGIDLIDTGFQREHMAACYVMAQAGEEQTELAIIETGTKDTVAILMDFLQQKNYRTEQVKYVIVTHVHLDHAGGAGRLMELLPNAQFVVHEKGARHMMDPSKLQAGATAVYGKSEFEKTYGDLIPIGDEKILTPKDGGSLELAGRKLTFIDTPGHARHHFCIFDELSEGFFTGDTFGLAYQELTNANGPFIFPTTTPVQFDPGALHQSLDKLMTYNPKRMFLTHYGMVENPGPLAEVLHQRLDQLVAIAKQTQQPAGPKRTEALFNQILEMLLLALNDHGSDMSEEQKKNILRPDAFLNAQGLEVWLSTQ